MKLDMVREGDEKKSIVQKPKPLTSNHAVISLPDFPINYGLFWRLSQNIFERIESHLRH